MRRSLWTRLEDEAAACPACGSARIRPLDVLPLPAAGARPVAFISGCRDCGLLFSNPLPTSEELERFYSRGGAWAAPQQERYARLEATRLKRLSRPPRPARDRPPRARDVLMQALAAHMPLDAPPPGARVLDFGCGDGKFLDRLQNRGWETYGIEPSADIAFLRHRRLEAPPEDASFDLVVLHHVLEHVLAPLDLLKQLARTLRPGGRMFLSVPRLDTLPDHRDLRYCINGRNHVMCFSETCLRVLLGRAGLSDAARIDSREVDNALTAGKPLQLRLIAVRTDRPPDPPANPLVDAENALAQYGASQGGVAARLRRFLPVRARAALMLNNRER